MKVKVADLKFTRYVNMNHVRHLRKSIQEQGMIFRPLIFQDLYIIAGNHRVAALDPDSEVEVDVIKENYTPRSPWLMVYNEPKQPGDPFRRLIED